MDSDIKLERSGIRVQGEYLFVNGGAFELNHPDRHVEDNAGYWRRAMVHENNDTLIVNHSDDYRGVVINGNRPEGIKLNGTVKCNDLVETRRIVATHHLGVSDSAALYVGGKSEFKKAPQVPDLMISELGENRGRGLVVPASLVEVIQALQEKIDSLEERVRNLESATR